MLDPAALESIGSDEKARELLQITWKILDAIHNGDAKIYAFYSSPELSCFEDVCPYRIDGLDFHLDMIRLMASNTENRPVRFDLLNPKVQLYGDAGIVSYTRLLTFDDAGKPQWTTYNETRVFVKIENSWKMVHFHRSPTH